MLVALVALIVFILGLVERGQEIPTNLLIRDHRVSSQEEIRQNSFSVGSPNLNVAFGFSDHHNSSEPVEDPDFGTLQAVLAKRRADGVFETEILPTHPCTEEELNNFGTPSPIFGPVAQFHHRKLKCLDDTTEIYGDFDSESQAFGIIHVACDRNVPDCRSDVEVSEWLMHKYTLVYFTQNEINPYTYEAQPST